jgi:hypothetical protein
MENYPTQTPNVPDNVLTKPVPLWSLLLAGIVGIILLCGLTGVAATKTPEPEVRTVTEYKTKEIKGDTVYKTDPDVEDQLNVCQTSLASALQIASDLNDVIVTISTAIQENDVDAIYGAVSDMERITEDINTLKPSVEQCNK